MGKGGKLALEASQICQDVIENLDLGLDLVDVDFIKEAKSQVLRVYIDKAGGVGLDDCATVSRAIDPVLDEKFSWTSPYMLEVSSPGLSRPLETVADFKRHQGEKLDFKLYKAREGLKTFTAHLQNVENDTLYLRISEKNARKEKKASKERKATKDTKDIAEQKILEVPIAECAKVVQHIDF